jgi:hypothetical protein
MADAGAGSFGALAEGLGKGLQLGSSLGANQQLKELRDRDQKMQEFKTFGDISKEYANDPDMGKILISDLGKRLGLTDDEIKSKHQFLSALNEERLRAVTSLAYQAGVDPNSMPLKDIMKMPNLDLAKYLQDQATKQSGQRVAGIEAGTPGASPTPGGAVAGAGGTPAAAAPVSAPGAMSPASPVQQGATPGAAIRPEQIAMLESGGNAAARNPRSTASGQYQITDQTRDDFANRYGIDRTNDDAIMRLKTAEDHRIFTQQHGRPATAAEGAMQWRFGGTGGAKIAAADPNTPIERLVTPDVMQANPELAGKTAGQVKGETEQKLGMAPAGATPGAAATPTAGGTISIPAPDGSTFDLPANAATRTAIRNKGAADRLQTAVERLETAAADPNTKIQDRAPMLARAEKLRADIKQLEGNAFVTLPPGSGAKFGSSNVGDVVTLNLITGEPKFTVQGKEKHIEATPAEEAEMGLAKGQKLLKTASGDMKIVDVGGETFHVMTQAERDAINKKGGNLAKDESYVISDRTGRPQQLSTLTQERERPRLAAKDDQEELSNLRKQASQSSEALRMSTVTKQLMDQYKGTGVAARPELFTRQLFDRLGFKGDASKGEALEGQFSKEFLTKGRMLPGALSEREGTRIQQAGPNMLRTPEGNRLLMDISNWSHQVNVDQHNLAENWNAERPLSEKDPKTGLNYYQTRDKAILLPPELSARLKAVEDDAPDPSKIKAWDFPISQATVGQMELLYKNRDKLTPAQREMAKKRQMELLQPAAQP